MTFRRVADLDGDGKVELAVPGAASHDVAVLRGNGDGTFQGKCVYPVGQTPYKLEVWDVTGDGKVDLVSRDIMGGDVALLPGNGDGTFAAAGSISLDGTNPAQRMEAMDADANQALRPSTYRLSQTAADDLPIMEARGVLHRRGLMSKPESVIVIGAGVAGLACANQLVQRGHDVVVLEARARLGGRVWSDDRLGFPIDLGASWIMGHEANPLTRLAHAAGAELVPTSYDEIAVFHQGKRVADDVLEDLSEGYAEVLAEIEGSASARSSDLSIAAAIKQALAGEELSELERRGCDYMFANLGLDAAADMDELGVAGQEPDKRPPGGDALIKGGYGLVPRYLARGLAIRTEHVVTAVTHGPAGVIVETNHGRFDAARCVVSLPLGVLKSNHVRFTPALPEQHRGALDRLRMGTLDKVALVLPRSIFPDDADFLGRMGDEPTRFPLFVNLERVCDRPALIGFVAGKLARTLEAKSDDEFIAIAMRTLREMLGTRVPDPTAATVVRWSSDPFACGAYSFVPVGGRESDRDILAAPIHDRLIFCGEATMRNHAGTVHGAYLSGLRAAARLTAAPDPKLPAFERRKLRSRRS